jgi:uncharacterized RDD family membrane protein YckC
MPPPMGMPMGIPVMSPHAGLLKRFLALVIDSILLFIVQFGLIFAFGFTLLDFFEADYSSTDYLAYQASSVAIVIGYFVMMEGVKQQTIGKMALGITVVTEDFQPITMRESLIRNVLRLLYNIPCLGFIIYIIDAIFIEQNDQRIGDKVAHTFVVRKDALENMAAGGMQQQPPMYQPPMYQP